jgi:hypothetical protein
MRYTNILLTYLQVKCKNPKKVTNKRKQLSLSRKENQKPVKNCKNKVLALPYESDSDSESDVEIVFDESDDCVDFDQIDKDHCLKCGLGDLEYDAWVGCAECPRWWHLHCCGDEELKDLYPDHIDQIPNFPFTCLFCEMA